MPHARATNARLPWRKAALALLVGLATLEIGVRVLVPFPLWKRRECWLNEAGGRRQVELQEVVIAPNSNEFRANLEFTWCYDPPGIVDPAAFDAQGCQAVSINADGLRGPRVEPARPEGVFRLAALGDSFTFGVGVTFENTWPEQLERLLGARLAERGDARTVEAVNLGMPGFDVPDILRFLETRVGLYQPDVVVYVLYLNDLRTADPAALLAVERELDGLLHDGPHGLARYSRALAILQREGARKRFQAARQLNDVLAPDSKEREVRLRALGKLVEAARSRGLDFRVAIFPILEGLEREYPNTQAHAELEAWFRAQGVPVLDLLPTFLGRNSSELWVHATDPHPNAGALDLAARAMLAGFWP